ncbi:MAG: hypothetical protein ACLF0G_02315 [Candidatus Brocadiia bacterium]
MGLSVLTRQPACGQLVELRLKGLPRYSNPFDPQVVRADAEVETPSGKRLTIPAFYMVPYERVRPPDAPRIVTHMRLFVGARRWRKGDRIEFLVDDLVLVDEETGERTVVDDFEGPLRWRAQGIALSRESRQAHGGEHSARLSLTIGEHRWPGMMRRLGEANWTRFDQLRLWARPVRGLETSQPTIEYYTRDGQKFQRPLRCLEGAKPGDWAELVWQLPPTRPPAQWQPTGQPQWRVRFRPQELGAHRCRGRVRDVHGERRSAWADFDVADGTTDGMLRPVAEDPRYLAFGSGKPFFAVGTNLLGNRLDSYTYYLEKLADAGGNFVRIWLAPRQMGFETKDAGPMRYAQDRAARLDALFRLCEREGVTVMTCITDFREVCSFHHSSDWANSPYNTANGGPCEAAVLFFTDQRAQAQYRAMLRYLVARYGHSPAVHSWEFFNEVNITDGWRQAPDAVRAWHREMAAYLWGIDVQRHPVTSSFAGIEDDALWEQAGMEIVQRHQYFDAGEAVVPEVVSAHEALRRHGKPVLMGEFGRRRNRYAALDGRGVSLHNGLWAAVVSGGCGTAMTWWWQWVDEHDLWGQFRAVATFVEGIEWPAEGFRPSQGARVEATPDPRHGFGPIAFSPRAGGFKPGPANQPVQVAIDAPGRPDPSEKLPRFLHGVRNHPEFHNPVTFDVRFPRPTAFGVVVDGVSGHGGAALEIRVDGKALLRREFADRWPQKREKMTRYDGTYEVPLPAGSHRVTVENGGNDWLVVRSYRFAAGRPSPPVRVFALRGRRTVLVWVWNSSHVWHRPVYETPLIRLGDVRVGLAGLVPGRYRVRPFDPWSGQWGEERLVGVGDDGRATLVVGRLESDHAFRLEAVP